MKIAVLIWRYVENIGNIYENYIWSNKTENGVEIDWTKECIHSALIKQSLGRD